VHFFESFEDGTTLMALHAFNKGTHHQAAMHIQTTMSASLAYISPYISGRDLQQVLHHLIQPCCVCQVQEADLQPATASFSPRSQGVVWFDYTASVTAHKHSFV